MPQFQFIQKEETLKVSIRGKQYTVIKSGQGIPCLLICLGTPSFRTLSKKFTETFEIYSSDMYWVTENGLDNIDTITMDTIIDDIQSLGDALNLKKYIIFAHSAYGIIALEFAKKYPDVAAGILMIGTPVNSNASVAKTNNEIFEKEADQSRRAIDKARRDELSREDFTKLTPAERWVREYIYRDAPRYWHNPEFDCTELWKGMHLDKLFVRLFNEILPNTNVLKDLENILTPIFLAAGVSDYDCCPWMWEKVKNLPPNFTIQTFKNSGHWPHYEEAELFDTSVKSWVEKIFNIEKRSNR